MMDLSGKGMYYSSYFSEFPKNHENFGGDTTLRLDCFGFGNSQTSSGCSHFGNPQNDPEDGCGLVLGLGPSPMAYSQGGRQPKGSSSSSSHLYAEDSDLQLGLSGGAGSLFGSIEFSNSSRVFCNDPKTKLVPVVDEGSTSAKKSGGYVPTLLLAPRTETEEQFSHMASEQSNNSHITSYSTGSEYVEPSLEKRAVHHVTKRCRFMGCTKGARGASGLCIGHGGGQRCQKPRCNKGAESRTAYCKAHGGGRRCMHLGCTKSAEGKTDFCIAHGGGRRCAHQEGCSKAARGRSGLCIKHGGGKRCRVEGCSRSAEGQAGLCISHGGGRRCQTEGCTKGAQGSTLFCKAHGGGKRCVFAGCTKGAEGSTPLCKAHGGGKRCLFDGGGICPKSVHGGTNFCVAHGGGKRCSVPGCTKSARGRTDCCVRHGGGKRCKIDNCGKSAQGSTDFCKAHGGGKRCCWANDTGKCQKFARGRSGMCASHSNMVHERPNNAKRGGMIASGLFHGLVLCGASSSCETSTLSDQSIVRPPPNKRPHLMIPSEVLVPRSMKSPPSSHSAQTTADERCKINGRDKNERTEFLVPEGRVHGGGLMSFLGGSLNNAVHGL